VTTDITEGQFSLSNDGSNPQAEFTDVRTDGNGQISIWYIATEESE